MRTTLIMFAILLFVLTLLSTFGGSISFQKEPFFADEEEDTAMPPVPPPVEPVQSLPSNPITGEQPPLDMQKNPLAVIGEMPNIPEMGGVPEPFTQEEKHKEQFAPF